MFDIYGQGINSDEALFNSYLLGAGGFSVGDYIWYNNKKGQVQAQNLSGIDF